MRVLSFTHPAILEIEKADSGSSPLRYPYVAPDSTSRDLEAIIAFDIIYFTLSCWLRTALCFVPDRGCSALCPIAGALPCVRSQALFFTPDRGGEWLMRISMKAWHTGSPSSRKVVLL